MSLISGERVEVVRTVRRVDDLGEPEVVRVDREDVQNVLVYPGATADLEASRPNGASVDMTLHFPKSYGRDLDGCTVVVRGVEYRVVGAPQRYAPDLTPGDWNMAVEVSRVDG